MRRRERDAEAADAAARLQRDRVRSSDLLCWPAGEREAVWSELIALGPAVREAAWLA